MAASPIQEITCYEVLSKVRLKMNSMIRTINRLIGGNFPEIEEEIEDWVLNYFLENYALPVIWKFFNAAIEGMGPPRNILVAYSSDTSMRVYMDRPSGVMPWRGFKSVAGPIVGEEDFDSGWNPEALRVGSPQYVGINKTPYPPGVSSKSMEILLDWPWKEES